LLVSGYRLYEDAMASPDEVLTFYGTHYDMLGSWLLASV